MVVSILVSLAFVVVVGMQVMSDRTNSDRADDWQRRAIGAEEIVDGLRVVIGERSQALNQRTVQANQLAARLDSTRTALSQSRVNVGTLTRRQQELAKENAIADAAERRQLETRQVALAAVAAAFSDCNQGLGVVVNAALGAKPKSIPANAKARLASCSRAEASLDAYVGRFG